jgi:hypothetical protein
MDNDALAEAALDEDEIDATLIYVAAFRQAS